MNKDEKIKDTYLQGTPYLDGTGVKYIYAVRLEQVCDEWCDPSYVLEKLLTDYNISRIRNDDMKRETIETRTKQLDDDLNNCAWIIYRLHDLSI